MQEIRETSSPPGAWTVVCLLWPVALLNYLDRQVLATLQPAVGHDIADVLDSEKYGYLLGIFLWVYAVMSPLSGLVADRLNRKWLIVGSLAVWSLVTELMGHAQTYNQLYWLRGLMGVSEALYIPAGLALIADFHRGRTRSLAVGIHMTGLYLGQILGGFGALAADMISWRATFHYLGLAGIGYGVVLTFFLRECRAPAESPRQPFGEACAGVMRGLRFLFYMGSFWVILYYFGAPSAPGWVVKNWLPTLFAKMDMSLLRQALPARLAALDDAHLASAVAKPLSTMIPAFSSLVGVLVGGLVADRWARRTPRGRIFTSAIGLTLTIPALIALGYGRIPACALTGGMLYGFGFGVFDANNMPILCQFVPSRYRAAAYGFMNLVGISVGALSTQVVGSLDRAGKLAQGMPFLAVPVLLAVILILRLKPVAST